MANERDVQHALGLLRSDETYVADARAGARVGNSVIGSLLSLTGTPRQYAEAAVIEALRRYDAKRKAAR